MKKYLSKRVLGQHRQFLSPLIANRCRNNDYDASAVIDNYDIDTRKHRFGKYSVDCQNFNHLLFWIIHSKNHFLYFVTFRGYKLRMPVILFLFFSSWGDLWRDVVGRVMAFSLVTFTFATDPNPSRMRTSKYPASAAFWARAGVTRILKARSLLGSDPSSLSPR